MESCEPSVGWPDLKNPVTITRPLCVSNGRNTEPTRHSQLELAVLVNHCLYVSLQAAAGLRCGDILSRNLDLTRRKGNDPDRPDEQVFVRFESLYDARRGIGRVYGRYRAVELPELERWKMDADWLLRTSWTLCRSDEAEREFVWRADKRIREHEHDRAEHKVSAVKRFIKAASLTDLLGRRNIGMVPLLCSATDRSLTARMHEVRGIGRRMDWRAVVLEHYLDQLVAECRLIRRAAQDAFTAHDIFGDKRTQRTLRFRANRMAEYARFLETVNVRTFSRAFAHVSHELLEISDLLHDSADIRDSAPLKQAQPLIGKIYQSMLLLEQQWRLEEILLVVADRLQYGFHLVAKQEELFVQELEDVIRILTTVDTVTGEKVGERFEMNVVPSVVARVRESLECLHCRPVDLQGIRDNLKAACLPI